MILAPYAPPTLLTLTSTLCGKEGEGEGRREREEREGGGGGEEGEGREGGGWGRGREGEFFQPGVASVQHKQCWSTCCY